MLMTFYLLLTMKKIPFFLIFLNNRHLNIKFTIEKQINHSIAFRVSIIKISHLKHITNRLQGVFSDYLQNQKQRTKIGSIYSDWEDIISGVSQGSILGLLLFNIFLCDLFLEDENNYFANYADTTPYSVGSTKTEVLENLSGITKKLFTWFANNQMKANDDKCHLLLSSPDDSALI